MLNTWIDNAENRFVTCLINNQLKVFSTKKKTSKQNQTKLEKKNQKTQPLKKKTQ